MDCRTATARGKAEQADIAAVHAREDAQTAVVCSKEFGGPDVGAKTTTSEATVTLDLSKKSNNLLSVTSNGAATNSSELLLSKTAVAK